MVRERQNVVLVTADSLRGDHCGFLNASADTTPHLDRVADEAVTFESAIAPGPRTPTAVPELLTGRPLPHVAPDNYVEQVERFRTHLQRHQTLPERLSDLGYTTVAFSTNPWTSTRCGVEEAFDEFRDLGTMRRTPIYELGSSVFSDTALETPLLWFERWRQDCSFFAQWPTFFDELADAIEDLPKPYFLWVFLMDTHNPYLVPPRDRVESSSLSTYYGLVRGNSAVSHASTQSYFRSDIPDHVDRCIRRAYRDAVRSVDRFVPNLLAAVADDDPLFAFTADHGEAFGEHGTYGHQQTLYEENVRVPLLIAGSEADGDERVSRPISLRRLPDLIEGYARDRTPIASDEWTDSAVVARSEGGDLLAVRTEDEKYIRSPEGAELYDLAVDPGETRNVADEVDRSRFEARIDEYLETVPTPDADRSGDELDADVRQRLSLLGYDE